MFTIVRTVRLAMKSLLLHKLRSGLTMLGIVFGVFSVIAMLAIGEGASSQAQEQVLALGATNVIVRTVKPPEGVSGANQSQSRVSSYGLTRTDFEVLRETIPGVVNAVPIREALQDARAGDKKMTVRLVGCTTDYLEVNNLTLMRGRFVSDQDRDNRNNVCAISATVADKMFVGVDPMGKAIRIEEIPFRIVGIMKPRQATAAVGGSLSGQDFSTDVYIPIETFWVRYGDLIVRRSSGSFSAEKIELNQVTLQIGDREDVRPAAEAVEETLRIRHAKQADYSTVVPLELLEQADQIRDIFNIVLGSIAAISLIVGGIGIMNIMLATVTERTREIGIRRALGATQRDIIVQFLTETIVLAGTGGLIGIALGLMTPFAFEGLQFIVNNFVLDGGTKNVSEIGKLFGDLKPVIAVWSLPVAFGISVGIGVMFGLYPAWKAAKLDPIEALRHE